MEIVVQLVGIYLLQTSKMLRLHCTCRYTPLSDLVDRNLEKRLIVKYDKHRILTEVDNCLECGYIMRKSKWTIKVECDAL